MKALILASGWALMIVGGTALLSAQTPIQPGRVVIAPRIALPNDDVSANPYSAAPKTTIATEETPHDRFMNRLWIASIFAAVGGTGLDAATSWGKLEGNSLLASSNGTFGAKGLGIKAGLAAAVIIPQICLRKHKELKGVFALGNFGEAGIFAGTAVHNLQVRSAATVH
jgi:hypothetical protein